MKHVEKICAKTHGLTRCVLCQRRRARESDRSPRLPKSWSGRVKHPRADRSNRLEPWGRDDETGLVIAPHGISPVSGTPRITPATVGSMKKPGLQPSRQVEYASTYASELNRNLTQILERRFEQLGFSPWDELIKIIQNPKAKDRHGEVIAHLPATCA